MLLSHGLAWVVVWSWGEGGEGGGKGLHAMWGGGMTFVFQSSPVLWHAKIYLSELSVALKNCYW